MNHKTHEKAQRRRRRLKVRAAREARRRVHEKQGTGKVPVELLTKEQGEDND